MKTFQPLLNFVRRALAIVTGLISFLTALIGFILLIQGNYILGFIILAILVWLLLFILFVYVGFARINPKFEGGKGIYRYEKYRTFALVGIVFIVVVAGILLAQDDIKNYIRIALIEDIKKPLIEKIVVGEAPNNYKLQITTYNPFEHEILLTNISIEFKSVASGVFCYPGVTYVLSGELNVTDKLDDTNFWNTNVSTNSEEFEGYVFLANGTFYETLCEKKFTTNFDSSLVLSPKAFTNFYITIPKIFLVTDAYSQASAPSTIPISQEIILSLDRPRDIDNYEQKFLYFEAILNDGSGMEYLLDFLND